MISVPIPAGISGSIQTPKLQEALYNVIRSQGVLISRPACELVTAISGEPRGFFVWKDELYSVFGKSLYKGIALAKESDIKGSGPISKAVGHNEIAIATGNTNYRFDGSLKTVDSSALPVSVSVAMVNNRFAWVPKDGRFVYYSGVLDASDVSTTSFFDAETLPDSNKFALTVGNDLYIFGDDSIERFRNVGTNDQPFVRADGSVIPIGYVGGLVESRNGFIFLGKEKEGGYQFYLFSQGSVSPVSTDAINEILNSDYARSQLEACQAQRLNWKGVDCYVFSLPDRDFVFSGGNPPSWGYFMSGTPGVDNLASWGYKNAILFKDEIYVQKLDGLYKLTSSSEDSTGDFSRGFKTFARIDNESQFVINYLDLKVSQQIKTGSVGISMSRDGVDWSPVMYRSTGGRRDAILRFRPSGGLGRYDGYAGISVYTTQDATFTLENMVLH